MTGEGKSLMDQLRGEAMKFHKPGKKEPHEQSDSAVSLPITLFFILHIQCSLKVRTLTKT